MPWPRRRCLKPAEQAVISGPAMEVGLISPVHFQEQLKALRERATIKNDKGEDIPFEGEAKEEFIRACEEGFPVIEKAFSRLYELGRFLLDVRSRLKPQKLYYAWLEFTGIPVGTARNYLQAYVRYRERLPQFAHLGIKKLLIASRMPDCVDYVEHHEEDISKQTAQELEEQVKARRKKARNPDKKPRGRKPTVQEIGRLRIWPSLDGTKLRIEGMTSTERDQLIETIKTLFSQAIE